MRKTAIFLFMVFFLIASNVLASQYVFDEEFSNNINKWPQINNAACTLQIQNGNYFIRNNQSGVSQNSHIIPLKLDYSQNFTIETKVKWLAGPENQGFGLVFGGKNEKNNYIGNHLRYEISRNGHYCIVFEDKGAVCPMVPWTKTDKVRTNDYNFLTVVKVGSDFHFYLNGQCLITLPNLQLYGNKIGLVAESQVHMAADYLKILQGIPDKLSRGQLEQFAQIQIHNVSVVPPVVSAAGVFAINLEYTIIDPARKGENLNFDMELSILKDNKVLFSENAQLSAPEGRRYFSKKQNLNATTQPGNYELKVVFKYRGKTQGQIRDLVIK